MRVRFYGRYAGEVLASLLLAAQAELRFNVDGAQPVFASHAHVVTPSTDPQTHPKTPSIFCVSCSIAVTLFRQRDGVEHTQLLRCRTEMKRSELL